MVESGKVISIIKSLMNMLLKLLFVKNGITLILPICFSAY
jgi:hypothetical protein